MASPLHYFFELDLTAFSQDVFIVDVEGTIALHGAHAADPASARNMDAVRKEKNIFLCSNALDQLRIERIAAAINVGCIALWGGKPWGRLPARFPRSSAIVVFGDKFLTDGLFAWRIGARFIRVRRLVCGKESFLEKIFLKIDDYLALFLK